MSDEKTYWICPGEGLGGRYGDHSCEGSGVIGGPRACPNCGRQCVEVDGRGIIVSEPVAVESDTCEAL